MEQKENKSPEEIQKEKEKFRKYALKNLQESKLSGLATAYLVNKEDSGYGKVDNDSVEQFLYGPTIGSGVKAHDLESGEKFDLVYNSLLGSRQDGKRYSGQVSEHEILKTSANIIHGSVASLKVGDIMNLLDRSYVQIKDKYKDKYISDLTQSENEEDKKVAQILEKGYIDYITVRNVSGALDKRAESLSGGLEELVKTEK